MTKSLKWWVLLGFSLTMASSVSAAEEPDWSEGALIASPRSNPYGIPSEYFLETRRAGYLHALEYPVEISGALIPWRTVTAFLDHPSPNPIRSLFQATFKTFSKIRSTDDLFIRTGLHAYPSSPEEGANEIPKRGDRFPTVRMGATILEYDGVEALTFSCAACHSANLFGKKILGMTNRFPRANELFVIGKKATALVPSSLFSEVMNATPAETEIYRRLRIRMKSVGSKNPTVLGLDTSLAQVALSLARRVPDDYASLDPHFARHPRPEKLSTFVADSKPAVWWNTKYKNRWLSDGSVVSGNPIYTNLLWNELGRGTDLHELEAWLDRNDSIVRELATAVFSTEAPRYTDFFDAERISLERAKNGQRVFDNTCARCHGFYRKAWDLPHSESLPLVDRLKTVEVDYPKKTRVIDVGTDPQRYQGMESLARGLNPLAISVRRGILIKPQKGYVPPPLVGIWARYPYFHNNSAPNLCAVLTPGKYRPTSYWAGEAIDREKDFDSECVGYPLGSRTPSEWKKDPEYHYFSGTPGLSNLGHDAGIFMKDGKEILTPEAKRDLIEFLKTL